MTTQTPDAAREAVIEQAHAAIRNGDYRVGYLRMCEAYGKLTALDSRAGDAGEAISALRALLVIAGTPITERQEAIFRRAHAIAFATPAPAVDAVPAGEVERLREALRSVRDDLHNENGLNLHSIVDTIWHGPAETTVDFIDAALSHGEGRK